MCIDNSDWIRETVAKFKEEPAPAETEKKPTRVDTAIMSPAQFRKLESEADFINQPRCEVCGQPAISRLRPMVDVGGEWSSGQRQFQPAGPWQWFCELHNPNRERVEPPPFTLLNDWVKGPEPSTFTTQLHTKMKLLAQQPQRVGRLTNLKKGIENAKRRLTTRRLENR